MKWELVNYGLNCNGWKYALWEGPNENYFEVYWVADNAEFNPKPNVNDGEPGTASLYYGRHLVYGRSPNFCRYGHPKSKEETWRIEDSQAMHTPRTGLTKIYGIRWEEFIANPSRYFMAAMIGA